MRATANCHGLCGRARIDDNIADGGLGHIAVLRIGVRASSADHGELRSAFLPEGEVLDGIVIDFQRSSSGRHNDYGVIATGSATHHDPGP